MKISQIELVRKVAIDFCIEFTENPYLCYTEHGFHAYFHTMLFNVIPENERFADWKGKKICIIQKEYRTANKLGKSKRQNWDVSVIKLPPEIDKGIKSQSYDYLRLAAVVEFGLNEGGEHLMDDIKRLCHRDSNTNSQFIIHLYRFSEPGNHFSNRDRSPNSKLFLTTKKIANLSKNYPVEIFYVLHDNTGQLESGAWLIKNGDVSKFG